jgi:hypothetical protein
MALNLFSHILAYFPMENEATAIDPRRGLIVVDPVEWIVRSLVSTVVLFRRYRWFHGTD